MVDRVLDWITELPSLLIYVVVGLGAAIENIIPPVPADTFVLFGGFLSARGAANVWVMFVVVWLANVASALLMYWLARAHAETIRGSRIGRWLLAPHQMERIRDFYGRWGTTAIFVSRFLPALRAIVPVFAGLSDLAFWRVALPTLIASGLWYGGLVYLGRIAGQNWEQIRDAVGAANTGLLLVAVILIAGLVFWWHRTRRVEER